jgi:putative component of membrane protein insertase Oxa1/YidC/SpoIIIJ protein YidD
VKYVSVALIKFYQLFISPYKGFRCAHHVLHERESCSNKAKNLISQRGLLKALPLIRARFIACREAYDYLQSMKSDSPRADLPCDFPCDIAIGDCGGGSMPDSSVSGWFSYCDLPFSWLNFSQRTGRIIIAAVLASLLAFSYVFYGRDINTVYITDLGDQNQNLLQRITQREYPKIRVLLVSSDEEVYSQIIKLDRVGSEYSLKLDKPLSSFKIDTLKVLDARVSIGSNTLVVGQVLEQFNNPKKNDQGVRFRYRIERRWHI